MDANDDGSGLGIMQQIRSRAKGIARPYRDEILNAADAQYAVIHATVKCVAHVDAVE